MLTVKANDQIGVPVVLAVLGGYNVFGVTCMSLKLLKKMYVAGADIISGDQIVTELNFIILDIQ